MSIRFRFTLALTAVGVLLFGTYALWAYRSERDDLRTAATREIRIIGQSLQTSIGNALRDQHRGDVEETLAALEALAPSVDIHVHDPVGASIARSRGASTDGAVEQLVSGTGASREEIVVFDPQEDPTRLIFTTPLTAEDGTLLGTIAITRPVDDLNADLVRTRDRLILVVVAFFVATIAVGLLLGTVYVKRPIMRLLDGVRQVRQGDFRSRVDPTDRADEIGDLVTELNSMIHALAESRAHTESETEARARLERGLQRVDKLVTIGQLSAGLAHEIGSPLQVLSGRASALLGHVDPEVRRQAELLVAQCERITRVVEQLLSFGRRKAVAIGPCDLGVPVRTVIDLLSGEARRRGVTLGLEVDEGSHEIAGDSDQLQQVALNLVRNALTATPNGGRIIVRVDHVGDSVRLSVRDSGAGIDAATRSRLFEPFFTTHASDGGTGLGLAVVRTIANEHRAKVDVYSEPGCGAEFVVSFPQRGEVLRG
jgi:signal transduction histidine kinase